MEGLQPKMCPFNMKKIVDYFFICANAPTSDLILENRAVSAAVWDAAV